MDVFIPFLPTGSKHNNLELRYCLRSVEKHIQGVDRVFISGDQVPDWIQNIEHLQIKDDPKQAPDWNMMNKVYHGISENILFMNDDHFILDDFNASTFPNFYHSTLDIYCRKRGKDAYGSRAINTKDWLVERGLKLLFFDIHYPIIYNLSKFRECMDQVPWSPKKAFIVKSLYGNYMKLPGTYVHDNKVTSIPLKLQVFSTYPHIKQSILNFLERRFPNKSKFEK